MLDHPATKPVFVLLLATICCYVWLGTVPLPLGGPDAILAVLTGLLSLVCLLVAVTRKPVAVSAEFLLLVGASLGILAISVGLHLYFGTTFALMREVIRIMMGIGILLAAWLTIDSTRRVTLLIGTFVLAVFVSALCGLVDALVFDFMRNTHPSRIGGLTTHVHFSAQAAVAIPLMFAFLLHNVRHNVFRLSARPGILLNAALGIVLAVLVVALFMNGSRAGILGSAIGMTVATCLSLAHRPIVRWRAVAMLLLVGAAGSSALLASVGERWNLDDRLLSRSDSSALARTRFVDDVLGHAAANPWGTAPARMPVDRTYTWYLPGHFAPPVIEADRWNPEAGQWVMLTAKPPDEALGRKTSYRWQKRTRDGWTDLVSDAAIHRFCPGPEGCRQTLRVIAYYGTFNWIPVNGMREVTVVWRDAAQASGARSEQITFVPEQIFGGDILPHNQALEILARYGFPGLALFALFWIVAVRSLYLAGRSALHRDDDRVMPAMFVIMISAALTSYFVTGLFHPTSPFSGHWYLFFLFGMIPAVRMLCGSHGPGRVSAGHRLPR